MSQFPPTIPAPVVWQPPRYEPGRPADFAATEAFSRGWKTLTEHYGSVLGGTMMNLGIQMAVALVPFIGGIASYFVTPLDVGTRLHLARLDRGEPSNATRAFEAFGSRYGPLLGAQLIINIGATLAMIPAILALVLGVVGIANGRGGVLAAGIAGVVIGVAMLLGAMLVYARVQFAPILLFDAPEGTCDFSHGFRLSWQRTRPYAWRLLGLAIVCTIVTLASILLLGIGLFLVGIPLAYAVSAGAYNLIFPNTVTGLCVKCGYDLRGTPGQPCPECGTAASAW